MYDILKKGDKMTISIDDLKGFDFSKKYLKIHENFTIKIKGKQVDFKIIEREYDGKKIYSIEYKYFTNNNLITRNTRYKNPFEIFHEIEKDITKSNEKLNSQAILIKKLLEIYNPDFDCWEEITRDLTGEVNILKLYPNYKSSKIPQDLSKEELAKYLDNFSKYELETLFKDLSILDFEVFQLNILGEDYEYLIKKAFSIHLFGEEFFNHQIFNEINKRYHDEYIYHVLKKYELNYDDSGLIVSSLRSIINNDSNVSINIDGIKLNKKIKEENIDLEDLSEEDRIRISVLRKEIYKSTDSNFTYKSVDFNNLDDSLTNSKYIYFLKAISSNSKSQIVMRYKIPKENRKDNSVQTIALNNGHIKIGNSKDNLSEYTVSQLKNVLKKYGLKVDGNKIHLINRIKENLSDEITNKEFPKRYFVLTEKGQQYLNKYYYLAEFYNVIPKNFTLNEFDRICNSNPEINPDDIIKCLVSEKWIIWDETLGEEPELDKYNNLEEQLEVIFKNRKLESNYYKNYYDSIVLV